MICHMAAVVLGVQQCYVCVGGEGSLEVDHQFPKEHLPPCQRGLLPPPKTCPPRYKGCLTQFKGEQITRMCGELDLTACQEANNVVYCYCGGQLCNTEVRPPSSDGTYSNGEGGGGGDGRGDDRGGGNGGTTDDEDLTDGSGVGDMTMVIASTELHFKPAPVSTLKPPADPSKAHTNQSLTYIQFAITTVVAVCLRAIL